MDTKVQFLPGDWEPVWSQMIEAVPVPEREGRFFPIGSIGIPILLESRLIAISIFNNEYPDTWKWGGTARQAINAGLTVGAANNASYDSKSLLLNKINLVAFSPIASSYSLSIDIPRWVLKFNISIWQYMGDVESGIEKINLKLTQIQGSLEAGS
jgi:hypothetical protein